MPSIRICYWIQATVTKLYFGCERKKLIFCSASAYLLVLMLELRIKSRTEILPFRDLSGSASHYLRYLFIVISIVLTSTCTTETHTGLLTYMFFYKHWSRNEYFDSIQTEKNLGFFFSICCFFKLRPFLIQNYHVLF